MFNFRCIILFVVITYCAASNAWCDYRTLVELANKSLEHGNLDKAAFLLAEAEKNFVRFTAQNLPAQQVARQKIQFSTDIADIFLKLGKTEQAVSRVELAFNVAKDTFGETHKDTYQAANSAAGMLMQLHRFEKAESYLQLCVQISRDLGGLTSEIYAASIANLANLRSVENDFENAKRLSEVAADIYNSLNLNTTENYIKIMMNLANSHNASKNREKAVYLFDQLERLIVKHFDANHPLMSMVLSGKANTLSDAQERVTLRERILNIDRMNAGELSVITAFSFFNLANALSTAKRYAAADEVYRRAMLIYEKLLSADSPQVMYVLNSFLSMQLAAIDYRQSFGMVRRLNAAKKGHRDAVLPVLMNMSRAGLILESQSFAESFHTLQYTTKTSVATAAGQLGARDFANSDQLAASARKVQDLKAERAVLDKLLTVELSQPHTNRRIPIEQILRKKIEEIDQLRNQILQYLDNKFPEFVALTESFPLPLQDVQSLLDEDEAVLAYAFDESGSYAWLVTKATANWQQIQINRSELAAMVDKIRKDVGTPNKDIDAQAIYDLYKIILKPFEPEIKSKTRLSLIPDGSLTSLPFSLLITSDPRRKALRDQDWLIRSHAITVIPSIYSLKAMRSKRRVPAPRAMIAFADPVYGSEQKSSRASIGSIPSYYRGSQLNVEKLRRSLPQLPGTRLEVQHIARLLQVPEADVMLGPSASETAVKTTNLENYRIVYFATHGLISSELASFTEDKAEPALVLSIPQIPTDVDDGVLLASEVARLRLNADWAVLSACNTASSDGSTAESLSGLAQAFLYAGARSLVVSHWQVDDRATAHLLSSLFEAKINQKLTNGEALRRAMLSMISVHSEAAYAHPYYWAPFIVVGEGLRG